MDRFEDRLQSMDDRFHGRLDSFHEALLHRGRTFAIASVTSIATAGLVAGIVGVVG